MTVAPGRLTAENADLHLATLEEARHNLLVSLLLAARNDPAKPLDVWSFPEPGSCAAQAPGGPVILGDLAPEQCTAVAESCADRAYSGVGGPEFTADWFVASARAQDHDFDDPMPQRIHALSEPPRYPGTPGAARPVGEDDIPLAADWMLAFLAEALPHEKTPPREALERRLCDGRTFLWVVDQRPVAMAAITRQLARAAAISHVYTPPAERGRGYGGSVTAAVVDAIRASGRATACLYTDLRNPASNRCYARIGFQPVCDSLYFARRTNDR